MGGVAWSSVEIRPKRSRAWCSILPSRRSQSQCILGDLVLANDKELDTHSHACVQPLPIPDRSFKNRDVQRSEPFPRSIGA